MNQFVERISRSGGFDLCGRIIRDEKDLVIFIDGIGRFTIPQGMVAATLMGLGESSISGPVPGVARLSESGRGLYMTIGDAEYAIPASRVRAVLSGEHRKGPVSRVKETREGS
ncbi:hypothetical protein [uncultured Methanospirillum sp.]|uniref:hypothetical protein n=1 Tax=uncultured Methanospirillum sp. TaxID=262503 RepID=UPI0029C92FBE|nr:hypothetical protein [uncultured Methanospirillum sp.]